MKVRAVSVVEPTPMIHDVHEADVPVPFGNDNVFEVASELRQVIGISEVVAVWTMLKPLAKAVVDPG